MKLGDRGPCCKFEMLEDLEDGKKSLTGETIATPGLELMPAA